MFYWLRGIHINFCFFFLVWQSILYLFLSMIILILLGEPSWYIFVYPFFFQFVNLLWTFDQWLYWFLLLLLLLLFWGTIHEELSALKYKRKKGCLTYNYSHYGYIISISSKWCRVMNPNHGLFNCIFSL